MPIISKPSKLNLLWASGGDILDPGDTKYQTGWGVEVPPRQWENYIQNKQDQAIAHINQHGIAVWDAETEYQAGKSYTQGADGTIYKAITTNKGSDPVLDIDGVNWTKPIMTPSDMVQAASSSQAQSQVDDDVFISPLQLANAFSGTNRQLSNTGHQKLPGGLILNWGREQVDYAAANTTYSVPVTFDKPFTNTVFTIYTTHITEDPRRVSSVAFVNNSTFTLYYSAPVASRNSINWFAIGI